MKNRVTFISKIILLWTILIISEFEIMIGSSSDDIRLKKMFRVDE